MIKRLLKQKFRLGQLINRILYEFLPKKRKVLNDPIWLSIYPTKRCTYSCSFCTNHAIKDNGKVIEAFQEEDCDLDFQTFKKIISKFRNAMVCTFCGVGEPLLTKDIFKMIKYASDKRIITEMVSNGSLFNEKIVKDIIKSGLNRLNISLNESDEEKHQKIVSTKVAYLPKIKTEIARLVSLKKDKELDLEIKISRVLTESTLDRARDFVKTGIELGVDRVVFHNLIYSGMDSYDLNEMLLDTESNRKFFEDLKAEFAKSIKIDTPVLIKNMEEIKPNCKWFWKNISIDGAGNVGSCGRFFIPKKEYGKFYDENVWNGKYFEEMREKFLKNDLTDYCKYCVENSHEE